MVATAKDSSLSTAVLGRLEQWGPGVVFVPRDLLGLAPSRGALDMALRRLVDAKRIRRIGRGLYDYPVTHPTLGALTPTPDDVAQAIARSTGETIVHSGARAANLLRLSTQVPARPVYLTSGTSRIVRVGNTSIQFRHAAPSRLLGGDSVPGLVLRALWHLGLKGVDDVVVAQLQGTLSRADLNGLAALRIQAPGWMQPVIHRIVQVDGPQGGGDAAGRAA